MKSVLISIQPKWCELIASGKKTVEVRKTRPKLDVPFKCYIYCTLPPKEELFTHGCIREYANELIRLQDGQIVYDYGMRLCCDIEDRPYTQDNFLCRKVIGEFVCNTIFDLTEAGLFAGMDEKNKSVIEEYSCVDIDELLNYKGDKNKIYGWSISDLVIYDKPKGLSEFYRECEKAECEYCPNLHFENTPNSYEGWCEFDEKIPLTRPPQSWCYVEGDEGK